MLTTLIRSLAIAALVLPAAAFAKSPNMPENVPYAVKARCDTLRQKFEAASAHPKNPAGLDAAREAASEGGALCRSSRYEEGGDTLARALRLIGESAD